jgi:hypothetical protein
VSGQNLTKSSLECFLGRKNGFLLPISMIGVASGDNPLLLLEMRGFEDMKKKAKDLGKGRLLLISRLPCRKYRLEKNQSKGIRKGKKK